MTEMWHPNIYENGDVCISILHPPVDDPQSGELPSERWNPTQNVRTVLLSVISLLNEPNTFSPGKSQNFNPIFAFFSKRWRLGDVQALEGVEGERWRVQDYYYETSEKISRRGEKR